MLTGAVALSCALVFAFDLWHSRGRYPVSPDAFHHAIVARNLVHGHGFRINMIQYHVGHYDGVEHVAEMHGMLQPVLLAGLFAFSGPERAMFRVPGFAYVAASGFLAFLYARRLFGAGAGVIACVLTLANGLLWFWAWYGQDDAGFAFWFLLAIFALDVALEKRTAASFVLAGLAAGGALLQKLTALILLAPMLAILLFRRGAPFRARLAWAGTWLAPWTLVFALYLLRNQASSGSPMFRFGAIDWVYKNQGLEAFFGVYDELPPLLTILRSIGWPRVIEIVTGQLGDFARATLSLVPVSGVDIEHYIAIPAFLSALGVAALLLHARRAPRFAALVALSYLAAAIFICCVWHFEMRFLTMLVPLLAVSLAGLVAGVWPLLRAPLARAGAAAAVALALAALVHAAFVFQRTWLEVPGAFSPMDACPGAIQWIRSETAPSDRILAFDPWTIAWETGRDAIVVPSGNRLDVEGIVARYRPAWLVVQPVFLRPRTRELIASMIALPTPGFAATPALVDGACAIYRIVGVPAGVVSGGAE
jgi:hypothetical protein